MVPPWPEHAGVHDTVCHFLRFDPYVRCVPVSEADKRVYYVGYQRALNLAATEDLTCAAAWQWCGDLRRCVAECVAQYDTDTVRAFDPLRRVS